MEIKGLTNLLMLQVADNQLDSLPDEIGLCVKLGTLNLVGNQLTELPASLMTLVDLSSLVVSFNSLTALPDNIDKLVRLSTLKVAHNSLTKLPANLSVTHNLTTLDVEHNQLTEIPDLSGLSKLIQLNVGQNLLANRPQLPTASDKFLHLAIQNNPLAVTAVDLVEWSKLKTICVSTSQSPLFAQAYSVVANQLGDTGVSTLPQELEDALPNVATLIVFSLGREVPPPPLSRHELQFEKMKQQYRTFVAPTGVAVFSRVNAS